MEATDTHFVRITGLANIPENELEEWTDYLVTAEVSYDGKYEKDNQDSTKTITHRLRLFNRIRIERQGKTALIGKARKGSPSQRLRSTLYRLFEWKGEGDFEKWYAGRIELFIKEVEREISE